MPRTRAFAVACEMQLALWAITMDPNVPAGQRAQAARAWDVLEERKRIIRGRPLPSATANALLSKRSAKPSLIASPAEPVPVQLKAHSFAPGNAGKRKMYPDPIEPKESLLATGTVVTEGGAEGPRDSAVHEDTLCAETEVSVELLEAIEGREGGVEWKGPKGSKGDEGKWGRSKQGRKELAEREERKRLEGQNGAGEEATRVDEGP